MKLLELRTRDPVKGDSVHNTTPFLAAVAGWSLALDAGIVTAKHGDHVRLIPLSNVAYMVPMVEEKKK